MELEMKQRVTTQAIYGSNANTAPVAVPVAAHAVPEHAPVKEKIVEAVKPAHTAEVELHNVKMKENLDQAIQQLNELMRDGGRNLSFAKDEALGITVILVKKQDTGEVIRQIPTEAAIKVAHSLKALKGLLLNEKV